MMGITSRRYTNFHFILIVSLMALLSGCAMTLASKSISGDTTQLSQMIRSGQIGPNDPIPANNGITYTPFCILVEMAGERNEADVLYMLGHGALVNQHCYIGTPLESVAFRAYAARNVPELRRKWYARAQLLIDHGAHLNSSANTMVAFEEKATWWRETIDQSDAERAAQARQDKRDSFFSAENLGAAIAIAGGAVNNYAAARNQTPSASLPSPVVRTYQPSSNSLASSKTAQAKPNSIPASQLKSAAATPYGGSLDSCNAPDSMTTGVNGIPPACANNRNNTFGWGNNAADACSAARRSIVTEFDAQSHNRSGCYCKENNAKVNGVEQRVVCWIAFDY